MSVSANSSHSDVLGNSPGPQEEPFPASTKYATGTVNSVSTAVSSVYFSDRVLVTISQDGRLSQWIQVPLSSASPTTFDTRLPTIGDDLLPQNHLSPKTLMGGGGEEREMLGHQYSMQIGNTISIRDPEESRTILVGLGLTKVDSTREAFFDMMELLAKVL